MPRNGIAVAYSSDCCSARSNGRNLAFDAPVPESGSHEDTAHPLQCLADILRSYHFGIDIREIDMHMVGGSGVYEGFDDGFVGVRQFGVFAHEGYLHRPVVMFDLVHELFPLLQVGFSVERQVELFEYRFVQVLCMHSQGYLVDGRDVDGLDHRPGFHVAEERHLAADVLAELLFGAQDEDVGLEPVLQHHLHRVLRRFGLEFTRSGHVGYERQVHHGRVPQAEFVSQLAYRLDIGKRLDVAYRTAHLGDDHVVLLLAAQQFDAAFDFVGDVRYDLYRLAEEIAAAFLVDDRLVNLACGDVVGLRGGYRGETLVVSQIEVGFGSVLGDVALAVFVGIERSRVHVDVRVEFLDGYRITACLQQACYGR